MDYKYYTIIPNTTDIQTNEMGESNTVDGDDKAARDHWENSVTLCFMTKS